MPVSQPNPSNANGVRCLSRREAAAMLSVSPRTLYEQTSPRGPIHPVRMGRRVLYSARRTGTLHRRRWRFRTRQFGGGTMSESRQRYGTRRSPSVEDIKSLAAGRWFDILIAAGIPADRLDGRGHQCPKCVGNDRFAAFPNFNVRGAVHCRQCLTRGTSPSPDDGIATLQWLFDLDFRATLGWLVDYLGMPPSDNRDRQSFKPKRRVAPEQKQEPDFDAIDFDELARRFFTEMHRDRSSRIFGR